MNLEALAATTKYQEAISRPNVFAGTAIEDWNRLAGTVKSSISVEALTNWLSQSDIPIEQAISTDHDKIISGIKTEMKMATRNKDGGYIWNQIRPTQDYGVVIFTAISPKSVRLFWCTKDEARQVGHPQHNANGKETLMITHPEGQFPNVFKEFTTAEPGLSTTPFWFTK